MADPTVGTTSNTTYASRTNTTVTAPTGIVDGDKLFYLLFVGRGSNPAATATAPTGFAAPNGGTWPIAIDNGGFWAHVYLWYKVASSESGNYTATHAVSSSQGVMIAVSGGSNAQPVATSNQGLGSAGGGTATATGITTAGVNALLLFFGTDWGSSANDLTPPTGMTERVDVAPLVYCATVVQAGAGASGNKSHTNNNNFASDPWSASLVVVEPGDPDQRNPFVKVLFRAA